MIIMYKIFNHFSPVGDIGIKKNMIYFYNYVIEYSNNRYYFYNKILDSITFILDKKYYTIKFAYKLIEIMSRDKRNNNKISYVNFDDINNLMFIFNSLR